MSKRGNLGSNVSDESWRGQRWEGRDRGSQHRSSQHSHTAAQSGGGRHSGSQHWDKQDGTPPHHPKPKRVHTPALIKLEAGDVTSASGMVLQAHLARGLQLEKDMNDAKRFFETAQTARAASIAATCQAESLTLPWYQNPTVVNLAKQRLKRFAERRRFRKGQRWRQLRR